MAIVYRTENNINGKFYYGVSKNDDNPKYKGSGSLLYKAFDKYGRKNFTKRTIMQFDTMEEAYNFEALMVDELLLQDPKCYNIHLGGYGGLDSQRKYSISGQIRFLDTSNSETKWLLGLRDKPNNKLTIKIDNKIYFGAPHAAKALGVTRMTIHRWLKNGKAKFLQNK